MREPNRQGPAAEDCSGGILAAGTPSAKGSQAKLNWQLLNYPLPTGPIAPRHA